MAGEDAECTPTTITAHLRPWILLGYDSIGVPSVSLLHLTQSKLSSGGFVGNDGDVTPRPKLSKDVLRTLNSAKGILMSVDSTATPANRNLHKKFLTVPRSLPSKLVMDVQRERWQVPHICCSYRSCFLKYRVGG